MALPPPPVTGDRGFRAGWRALLQVVAVVGTLGVVLVATLAALHLGPAVLCALAWGAGTYLLGWVLLARTNRWWTALGALVVSATVVTVVVGLVAVRLTGADATYGTPIERVASADGEVEALTYEFFSAVDPGWNVVLQRPGGGDRQWIWRGVDLPAISRVRFTGPDRVEIVVADGTVYPVAFDPETLEPSERYCRSPGSCTEPPFDAYTSTGR